MNTAWDNFIDRYKHKLIAMSLCEILEAFYWYFQGDIERAAKTIDFYIKAERRHPDF